MDTKDPIATVGRLMVADVEAADRDELAMFVADVTRLRNWVAALELRGARRSRVLAAVGQGEAPESLLGREGRRAGRDVVTVCERDRVCETAPSFESALADGTVSAGHVDALAAATKRLDADLRDEFFTSEPLLLAAAAGGRSVDEFSRECRDLARQVVAFNSPGSHAEELAVLDAGRSTRSANRAQRRALRAMHRTCGHPDCQVPFSMCKIDHVLWWWRDRGRSDISNMIPPCEKHHHLVHEGGWTLSMTPDRVATWIRPGGGISWTGTCTDRAPNGVASRPPP